MYDVDDSGCINLQEMTNIISTMDELEGEEKVKFQIWHRGYGEGQIIWADDVNGDSNILVLLIHWWLGRLFIGWITQLTHFLDQIIAPPNNFEYS